MPFFDKDKLLYIHIPKCGWTSIEDFLISCGNEMSLFTGHSNFLNGHSAQHSTFNELNDFGYVTDDIKIFTVIRNPIDRTISEFFFIKKFIHKEKHNYDTFDDFLTQFLNKENSKKFDNHNLPSYEFLCDKDGVINNKIKIFNFFDEKDICEYLGYPNKKITFNRLKTNKGDFKITEKQKNKIKKYFKIDYQKFNFND